MSCTEENSNPLDDDPFLRRTQNVGLKHLLHDITM